VALQGEKEGDIDADPLAQQGLDRRHALLGPGHLDQQVRAIDGGVESPGLLDRRLGVACQPGRDFERDEAVAPRRLLVDRQEEVAGLADIGRRDRLEDRQWVLALRDQALDLGVIGVARADRLGEDRRVRGQPAQAVLLDQAAQLAAAHQVARDVVEPDALPLRREGDERILPCILRPDGVAGRGLRRSGHRSLLLARPLVS
jgi:hypothetical protein